MKSYSLKTIKNIDSPALTAIIEYWKEYDVTTVILALFELRDREYPYLFKINKTLLKFYKKNNFYDENDLMKKFLEDNNSLSYNEFCEKNGLEENQSSVLGNEEPSVGQDSQNESKIEKLKELVELLKLEVISREEFESLKKEILNPLTQLKNTKLEKKPSLKISRVEVTKLQETKTTDIFASISFAAGVGGFLILPMIFVPIGYIASIISYYRIKENDNLKGSGLRIVGAILTTINIFWLMYQFQIGPFSNL